MTKNEVLALAKIAKAAEAQVMSMGMMNSPTDLEEQVASRARYQMMIDVWDAKRAEYNAAFEKWQAAGFPDL
jgi:uncharacterized protein YfbU (UPF0304 family)